MSAQIQSPPELHQGSRSVDDYVEEFSLLLTRTEIYDSTEQLVSRFIGRLRPHLQTALAQFDPTTLGNPIGVWLPLNSNNNGRHLGQDKQLVLVL